MPLRFAEPAAEAYRFPLLIGHLLDSALTTAGDQEIVYRDQARITYRILRERIGRLATLLAAHGVEQGTTVAVMDWDSHRYLEAYFAVPMMGAVLQTVNVRMAPAQIAYTLAHSQAKVLLVHRDFFPIIEAILPELPALESVIVIMDGEIQRLPAFVHGEYEALSAAASPDFNFQEFDENAIATLFHTSGTTGDPKAVCFSHRQLVLHTLAACGPFGDTRHRGFGIDDVYMPLTPMFHVHAWGAPYIATMLGLKQIYPGRYEPEMICRLRTEHGVTYSHCVPSILRMVLDAADRTGTDLSGWMMIIGGSALTSSLCEEARGRGMEIAAGYGMSETAPIVSISHRRPGAEAGDPDEVARLTKAGFPVPLVSARIVDEEMNPLPADGVTRGELVLRAPWLTPCYVGDMAASAALWRGGWMHTQDVATIDTEGVIDIRDRLKDVIKSGGEWLDSLFLEALIATVEGVADVAVIAVPDARWGERPLAVIVSAPGAKPTLAAINAPIEQAIAQGRLQSYAKIDSMVTMDALPKTSVGKIDKKLLRTRFARDRALVRHPHYDGRAVSNFPQHEVHVMSHQYSGGCEHVHTHSDHDPLDVHTCHCSVCKRVTGQSTTHVAFFKYGDLKVDNPNGLKRQPYNDQNPNGPLELCTCSVCGQPIMVDDKQRRVRVIAPNLMGYDESKLPATYHAFFDPSAGAPKPHDGRPVYEALRPDFVWPEPAG